MPKTRASRRRHSDDDAAAAASSRKTLEIALDDVDADVDAGRLAKGERQERKKSRKRRAPLVDLSTNAAKSIKTVGSSLRVLRSSLTSKRANTSSSSSSAATVDLTRENEEDEGGDEVAVGEQSEDDEGGDQPFMLQPMDDASFPKSITKALRGMGVTYLASFGARVQLVPGVEWPCPLVRAPSDTEDIDVRRLHDHLYCPMYANNVYGNLRILELRNFVRADVMEKQPELRHSMRAVLVDWLADVAKETPLMTDTLFLAVNYLDRCLEVMKVSKAELQLLGCTCLFVAAKYEEMKLPDLDHYVWVCDNMYTRDDILSMEMRVLEALDYRLTAATAKLFLRRFQRAARVSLEEKHLGNYLAELVLQVCSAPCAMGHAHRLFSSPSTPNTFSGIPPTQTGSPFPSRAAFARGRHGRLPRAHHAVWGSRRGAHPEQGRP